MTEENQPFIDSTNLIQYQRECYSCEYTDVGFAKAENCPECGGKLYIIEPT